MWAFLSVRYKKFNLHGPCWFGFIRTRSAKKVHIFQYTGKSVRMCFDENENSNVQFKSKVSTIDAKHGSMKTFSVGPMVMRRFIHTQANSELVVRIFCCGLINMCNTCV